MSHETNTKLEFMLKKLIQLIKSEKFTFETNNYTYIHFVHEISVSMGNRSTLGNKIKRSIVDILNFMKITKMEEIPENLLNQDEIQILKLAIIKFR